MPHYAVRVDRHVTLPRPPVRCDRYRPIPRTSSRLRRSQREHLPPPDTGGQLDLLAPTPIFAACMGEYLVGSRVRTRDGRIFGRVSAWIPYPAMLGAPWGVAIVRRGSARGTPYLVDLSGALFHGSDITIAHEAQTVLAAPRLTVPGPELTTAQRHQVHAYYRSRGHSLAA